MAALKEIGWPELPLDLPAGRLSVAEQQLVEIARSVAIGCRVLVSRRADQHAPAADIANAFALIRRLRDAGSRSSTSPSYSKKLSDGDRFTALRDGRTTGSGDRVDAWSIASWR